MPIPPVDTLVKYESPIMVRLRSLRAPNRTPPAFLRERLRVASPCLPRRSRGASASDVWSLTVPSPSPPADHHNERLAHPEKHQGRSRRG